MRLRHTRHGNALHLGRDELVLHGQGALLCPVAAFLLELFERRHRCFAAVATTRVFFGRVQFNFMIDDGWLLGLGGEHVGLAGARAVRRDFGGLDLLVLGSFKSAWLALDHDLFVADDGLNVLLDQDAAHGELLLSFLVFLIRHCVQFLRLDADQVAKGVAVTDAFICVHFHGGGRSLMAEIVGVSSGAIEVVVRVLGLLL